MVGAKVGVLALTVASHAASVVCVVLAVHS
jgi:hypothetical protein